MSLPRRPSLTSEQGLTLIEVMIATLVLVVGILALLYNFDSSRKLTLVAERRTTAAHRAEQELEHLQSIPYSELAMTSAPTKSSETSNPDFYVTSSGTGCKSEGYGCYEYDKEHVGYAETLVKATETCGSPAKEGCGVISATPTEWKAGDLSGYLYDFVTWHEDSKCGASCEKEGGKNYKRLTVVVTVTTPKLGHAMAPIRMEMMVADPKAGGASGKNPLESPTTTCGNNESCTYGLSKGTSHFYYLHNWQVEESKEEAGALTGSNEVHATVAASATSCTATTTSSACPHPDLMDSKLPKTEELYDYSTNLNSSGFTDTATTEKYGGRALLAEGACSITPSWGAASEENYRSEFWVTTPLAAEEKLLGIGALSLDTQTLGGAAGEVTLCVRIYDVPESLTNLVQKPPTLVGYSSYTLSAWPTSLTELSFLFEYLPKTTYAIAKGHRIGLRLSTTTAGIGVAYDSAKYAPSLMQLNTE